VFGVRLAIGNNQPQFNSRVLTVNNFWGYLEIIADGIAWISMLLTLPHLTLSSLVSRGQEMRRSAFSRTDGPPSRWPHLFIWI